MPHREYRLHNVSLQPAPAKAPFCSSSSRLLKTHRMLGWCCCLRPQCHGEAMTLLPPQIVHVVLVEGSGKAFPVQHAGTVRLVLDAVAPGAKLTVLHLARG